MTTTPDPALAVGAALERERIAAITSLPEAVGREATALKLAMSTDMAPASVAALLTTIPMTSAFPAGSRSRDSQIGLVVDRVDDPTTASILSPAQLARKVNEAP